MSLLLFLLLFLPQFHEFEASDLNVGTTLFTKADSCKECWSPENVALLTSRMILEDLLPSTSVLVIDSNEFVSDLVEYFRIILETVRQETRGKTKHITLLALTDLLGGYLHHAVLPIARYAYYAGLIDYDSMATLLGLFDELKWFLRTSGQGWAKPIPQNIENFEIQRIPMQDPIDKDKCSNLIFVEGDHPDEKEKSPRCDVTIPLPFFDSLTKPSAVALPTKTCPLYNIETNSSNYLLMKFFITSFKCLQLKNVKGETMEKFQNEFCAWIEEQIIPRLADEKLYAAFGGVLRVRLTLKRLGVSQNNLEKQIDEFRHAGDTSVQSENVAPLGRPLSKANMILFAVLITIFVWFILGTMFICYKMKQTKQKPCFPEGGDKTTTCSSLVSSKYFYPEQPKYNKDKRGMLRSAVEPSELTIDSYHKRRSNKSQYPVDSLHYHKLKLRDQGKPAGGRQEIIIKACRCGDDDHEEDVEAEEDPVTPSSAAQVASSHNEGRLPSITEISEQSTSTPGRGRASVGGSTTPSNDPKRYGKVNKEVYMETESDSEDTSEGDV